jgi:hypothetical protein
MNIQSQDISNQDYTYNPSRELIQHTNQLIKELRRHSQELTSYAVRMEKLVGMVGSGNATHPSGIGSNKVISYDQSIGVSDNYQKTIHTNLDNSQHKDQELNNSNVDQLLLDTVTQADEYLKKHKKNLYKQQNNKKQIPDDYMSNEDGWK